MKKATRPSTRLTDREVEFCIDALEFTLAGLDDGSGMGMEKDEAEQFAEHARKALDKLKERRERAK